MAGVAVPGAQQAPPQNEPRPVFKASVARVSVAATVRDGRGRPVTNLTQADFNSTTTDKTTRFSTSVARGPVGLGLLVDVSGSMDVAEKRAAARETSRLLVQALSRATTRWGCSRSTGPRRVAAVSARARRGPQEARGLELLRPHQRVRRDRRNGRSAWRSPRGPRRAVVVLTDGDDNASKLRPRKCPASRAASTCRLRLRRRLAARPRGHARP